MMKEAALIAVAIVIAGFLSGGRYGITGDGIGATRVDRWTGQTCTFAGCSTWGSE